jgi:hypothetical protein
MRNIDILLPLETGVIRVGDAWLGHQTGLIHLAFYSGIDMGASTFYARPLAVTDGNAAAWPAPRFVGKVVRWTG